MFGLCFGFLLRVNCAKRDCVWHEFHFLSVNYAKHILKAPLRAGARSVFEYECFDGGWRRGTGTGTGTGTYNETEADAQG